MRRGLLPLLAMTALAVLAACGKKGPPLAPLHLVPGPVTDVVATRVADEIRIAFTLPTKNTNGPGPIALDRVEVYAATVAPGGAAPTDAELMRSAQVVGTVSVKPAPVEGETPPEGSREDRRPAPGEKAAFVEQISDATRKPLTQAARTDPGVAGVPSGPPTGGTVAQPAKPAAGGAGLQAGQPQAENKAVPVDYPVRVYVLRGRTRGGRPGQPSARIEVPLLPAPPPPPAIQAGFTATAITITWTPPVAEIGGAPIAYNVYARGEAVPLHPEPVVGASFEQPYSDFGTERCFAVRTVATVGGVKIEGTGTEPVCVTPTDTFPPSPPKGVAAVPAPGSISLIWDASPEADVAGYVVLRGEAPGDTLQPLTPEPIQETRFTDTTVAAGVRYVYAVVALDKATPPNRSAPSARVEETAR